MHNSVANILRRIGFGIIVIGILGGILLANDNSVADIFNTEFVWPVLIATWIYALISGILFIGFAEVLELLHRLSIGTHDNDINQKTLNELIKLNTTLEKNNEVLNQISKEQHSIKSKVSLTNSNENIKQQGNETRADQLFMENIELKSIGTFDFNKISKYYPSYKVIDHILITPFNDIYVVIYQNNIELIRYVGYTPTILSDTDITSIEGLNDWYNKMSKCLKTSV